MKIVRMDNSEFGYANRLELEVLSCNIRDAAYLVGRTEDTIGLFDDQGKRVARATWPNGSRAYLYSEGGDFDPVCPELSAYKY